MSELTLNQQARIERVLRQRRARKRIFLEESLKPGLPFDKRVDWLNILVAFAVGIGVLIAGITWMLTSRPLHTNLPSLDQQTPSVTVWAGEEGSK